MAVIANPKGGVGKNTLAINLAGCSTTWGHAVMLDDTDRQQFLREWFTLRPETAKPARTWEVNAGHIAKPSKGTTHVVLDTPAGLHGWRLGDLIEMSGCVIVPLQPSMFDIPVTQIFLRKLVDEKPVHHGGARLDVVGMCVDMHTRAAEQLRHFAQGLEVLIFGHLHNAQSYVQLTVHGLMLQDVAPPRVARDVEQRGGILNWLGESLPQARVADTSAAT